MNAQVVYDSVVQYMISTGCPPTIREVMRLTGLRSTSSVSYYLRRLARMKLLVRVGRCYVPVEIRRYLAGYEKEGIA